MDGFWLLRKSEPKQKAHYVSGKGDLDGHESGTSRRADRFRGGIVERGSSLLRPKKTGPLINGVFIYYAKFAFSHF
jgi:hypothetical protein